MISQHIVDRIGPDGLREMYRRMVAIRTFETSAEKLFSSGELVGSIHTSVGQEGVCVGAGMAVDRQDFMTGNHRSHGHPIGKGAPLNVLMAELFGKESGICHGYGGSMHLADFGIGSLGEAAIVASSLPIAVGAALASRLEGWDRIVLAFFGDGAANSGTFHEALNMAAIWKLPVIFLCENNQYAVSTRHDTVCSVEFIAQRGAAYNMRAETIDGQNALAVWESVDRAAQLARSGGGPSLVEALTYRYGDHSYLMSRLKYRTDEEVAEWRRNDPIENLAVELKSAGYATDEDLAAIRAGVHDEIKAAIEFSRAGTAPTSEHLWERMYSDPTGFPERRHNRAWLAATAPAE